MNSALMIGCHGCRQYGFSMCKGTKNQILNLRKLGPDADEIIKYLDVHYKAFDSVIVDKNAVNSLLEFIMKRDLVPEHIKKLLYEYRVMHKPCGLYFYVETDLENM